MSKKANTRVTVATMRGQRSDGVNKGNKSDDYVENRVYVALARVGIDQRVQHEMFKMLEPVASLKR